MLRGAALEAIFELDSTTGRALALAALEGDADNEVRGTAAALLGACDDRASLDALLKALVGPSPLVREGATRGLDRRADAACAPALFEAWHQCRFGALRPRRPLPGLRLRKLRLTRADGLRQRPSLSGAAARRRGRPAPAILLTPTEAFMISFRTSTSALLRPLLAGLSAIGLLLAGRVAPASEGQALIGPGLAPVDAPASTTTLDLGDGLPLDIAAVYDQSSPDPQSSLPEGAGVAFGLAVGAESLAALLGAPEGAWSLDLAGQGYVLEGVRLVSLRLPPPPAPNPSGGSKDPTYFDLEFEAEQVRWSKGGGEDALPSPPAFAAGGAGMPGPWAGAGAAATTEVEQAFVVDPEANGTFSFSIGEAEAGAWQGLAESGEAFDHRFVYSMTGGAVELFATGARVAAPPQPAADKPGRFNVSIYVEKMSFNLNSFDSPLSYAARSAGRHPCSGPRYSGSILSGLRRGPAKPAQISGGRH